MTQPLAVPPPTPPVPDDQAHLGTLGPLGRAVSMLGHGLALVDRSHRLLWHNLALADRCLTQGAESPAEGPLRPGPRQAETPVFIGQPLPDLLERLGLTTGQATQLRKALDAGAPLRLNLRREGADGACDSWTVELAPTTSADGAPHTGHLMLLMDASAQVQQQLHTAQQQAVLAHTVEAAGLGTWRWDMRTDALSFNDRLMSMLGWPPGDGPGTLNTWSSLVHPEDRLVWQAALRRHLADPTIPCRADLRVRRPDGQWAAVQSCGVVIAHDADGAPREMAGINIDLTEQSQMQAMLRHAAHTDGLTQLPNRAAVFDHVQRVIDRAQHQPDFGYAVLFMDFDRFKLINDTLGHAAGDELLRQIAQRLRGALRSSDAVRHGASYRHTAGRIGGDEFVVVLEGVQGRDEAAAVARRLMDVLAAPYDLGPQIVHSSASIGIVTSELAANDANTLMRDADTAMYEAKRAGRARWVMFDPSMHERVARGVALERDLRLALDQGHLHVVYQPVLPLNKGAVLGVEALVRWRHPTRGLVPPADFISVAEDTGLILPLGAFVLAQACQHFVAWQAALGAAAPVTLSVNLSPRQLQAPQLIDDVKRCLADTGIDPTRLQLEVTESLAAQDELVRAKLCELKALGLRLALDDFGTGYSSLACLHLLPVDSVKIDRSFVEHALTSDYHRVLIEATIRVAQTLGMDTVAEGIETADQAELMRRLQCDRGQGWLFSHPMETAELCEWLLAHAGAAVRAA